MAKLACMYTAQLTVACFLYFTVDGTAEALSFPPLKWACNPLANRLKCSGRKRLMLALLLLPQGKLPNPLSGFGRN